MTVIHPTAPYRLAGAALSAWTLFERRFPATTDYGPAVTTRNGARSLDRTDPNFERLLRAPGD